MRPKFLLLTAFLVFTTFTALRASNYEYAVVNYNSQGGIQVTTRTVQRIPCDSGVDCHTRLLHKVEQMNDDGWELLNTSATYSPSGGLETYIFYLKRKVKG
jgi:hypothetical protein